MSLEPIVFNRVWLSTLEHWQTFYKIADQATPKEQARGIYNLPEGFPQTRLFGLSRPFPLVMVANGRLTLTHEQLHFEAFRLRQFGSRIYHLQNELTFVLPLSEIVTVESCLLQSPIIEGFELPFVRVTSQREGGVEADFMLCVAGFGIYSKWIHQQTTSLFEVLQRLLDEHSQPDWAYAGSMGDDKRPSYPLPLAPTHFSKENTVSSRMNLELFAKIAIPIVILGNAFLFFSTYGMNVFDLPTSELMLLIGLEVIVRGLLFGLGLIAFYWLILTIIFWWLRRK